jgi:anti-anti-sigma regulatory factor
MLVTTVEPGDVFVVTLRVVKFDAAVARSVRRDLSAPLRRGIPVVLDVKGVEFSDSSGLGTLCALHEQFGPDLLVLAGCSDRLASIVARAPRHRLPRRFRSVQEAIRAVSTGCPAEREHEGPDGSRAANRVFPSHSPSLPRSQAPLNDFAPDVDHD